MPFQGFSDGLYLVKQKLNKKPFVDHYGIVDIGNILNHPQGNPDMPIVIHQAVPRIRVDWLSNTGTWDIIGKVNDDQLINAKERIDEALTNPAYDLFNNNCEHFARYVITGIKESKQLQAVGVGVTLWAILWSIWKINKETKPERR